MIKTGIKTTEFWIVALSNLFTALTALGVRLPDQNQLTAMMCAIATNIVALIYAWLRTHIKATHPVVASPIWVNPDPEESTDSVSTT
jgi:hypothetical protein